MKLSDKYAHTHRYVMWHEVFTSREVFTLRECRDCGARIRELKDRRTSTPEARRPCRFRQDLLLMWLRGKHDDLFATLKSMTFVDRAMEVRRLCRAMADLDADREPDDRTEELPRFFDECMRQLASCSPAGEGEKE